MTTRKIQVVFLPQLEHYGSNPYWQQLSSSLVKEGVVFVTTPDSLYLQARWLWHNRDKVDVIHLHFLQHHYAANEQQASFQLLAKFVGKLLLARSLGYRIVWTVHNLYPHESLHPAIVEWLAHFFTAQLATALIVHCEQGRAAVAREFRRYRNVHTIAHPSYIGVYPNTMSKEEARAKLGLSTARRVFLFLGTIRPYKGLHVLIEAFHQIPGDGQALIIAGKPWQTMSECDLEALKQNDERIIIVPKFIPDNELQCYFNAADVVVLPYTDVLSSGSVLLAMSFGRPIVAPAIGCLSDIVTPDVGILYPASAQDGLLVALNKCMTTDLVTLGQNAYQRAANLTWAQMASNTLKTYHKDQ